MGARPCGYSMKHYAICPACGAQPGFPCLYPGRQLHLWGDIDGSKLPAVKHGTNAKPALSGCMLKGSEK